MANGLKTIQSMIAAQDYPPEVAATILRSVEEAGTEEAILSGLSVLPHPVDAIAHHERLEAEAGRRKLNAADADTVKGLQDRLAALESRLLAESPSPPTEESPPEPSPPPPPSHPQVQRR